MPQLSPALASLSVAEKRHLLALLEERERRQRENRLRYYQPYPKQADFHAAGLTHRERLFMAGNQLGKTLAGGAEVAYHLTGDYPDWWVGRRFDKPTTWWAAGFTSESTRDNPQRILLGPPAMEAEWGSGMLPKDRILGIQKRAHGVSGAVDTIVVRHKAGGKSQVGFKTYDQGRLKWQGPTLHGVWYDEEPPPDIYAEGMTRTNVHQGINIITFTPLLGMTEVVRLFLQNPSGARAVTQMTIDDAPHYTAEERAAIIASYPEHEREARAKGIPVMGSGRVFPVAESTLVVDPFPVPDWPLIGGMDFGWDHPFAAVRMAHNRDTDTVYIVGEYRAREKTPLEHAAALTGWGPIPWSWPHDGLQHDKGSGEQLAVTYRKHGLRMLKERAQFEDGTNGLEAGITRLLERMQTGRLKVFSTCTQWLDEFRLYHRKDGLIVKEQDDLMSATRYAEMELRHAERLSRVQMGHQPITVPNDWNVHG